MLAKDVSVYQDVYCLSDTPLEQVFEILLEKDCGCVPIVESLAHRNPIGSVSEHDICLKTIRDGLNPKRLTAARVMNGDFTTVSAGASLEECASLMRRTGCRRLFVVDENGAFVGILTEERLADDKPKLSISRPSATFEACPVISRQIHLAY